jgi:hypothetical protein
MGLKKVAAANRNNGKEASKGKANGKKDKGGLLLERTTFDDTNAKIKEQLEGAGGQ